MKDGPPPIVILQLLPNFDPTFVLSLRLEKAQRRAKLYYTARTKR
jgi:hypothetical protein